MELRICLYALNDLGKVSPDALGIRRGLPLPKQAYDIAKSLDLVERHGYLRCSASPRLFNCGRNPYRPQRLP